MTIASDRRPSIRQLANESEVDPSAFSLKRLAWAYGCSLRDSAEEKVLERALRERILKEAKESDGSR